MRKKLKCLSKKALFLIFFFTYFHCSGQIARSINGMVVSDFKTPSGNVRVTLPDDIRPGDQITGTVVAAPEGKTENDQRRNREKIDALTLQFPGLALTLRDLLKGSNNNNFSFTVPSQTGSGGNAELDLLDNGRNIGESVIPVTPLRFINPELPKAIIELQNPLIEKDQPYIVLRSANADMNKYEYLVKGPGGQLRNLSVTAASPRQAVVQLPPDIPVGQGTIVVRPKGSTNPTESISFNYTQVQVNYQVGKNTLQKGETTVLKGMIEGLDPKVHHNPTLLLDNITTNTITLERGNNQAIYITASDQNGDGKAGEFYFTRTITGVTPGPFTINTLLNLPPADLGDPFHAQMRSLQNSSEFNEWMEALKYDLRNFIKNQSATRTGTANRQNAQTVLDNLKPAGMNDDLELVKTYNNNLLRALIIDEKQLKDWDCSFVNGEMALNPLSDQLDGSTKQVDWEILNHFAENIEYRAEKAGYKKRFGNLVNKMMLLTAVRQTYPLGSDTYNDLIHKLYKQFTTAISGLSDESLPKYKRPAEKDMIGWLDPAKKTMWAVQQDIPSIISSIGAKKGTDGTYSFSGINTMGGTVLCNFKIVPSTVSQIHTLYKQVADILMNQAAHNNQKDTKEEIGGKPLWEPGLIIKQDTDTKTGTIYRFYKNASCVNREDYEYAYTKVSIDCARETKTRWKNDLTDENIRDSILKNANFDFRAYQEEVTTGRYYKITYKKPVYKCGAGDEYCTEILSIYSTVTVYDDAKCTIEVSRYIPEKGHKFMCLKSQ